MSETVSAAAGGRWSVAVTGSSGFIGGALARTLERAGHRVVRIVRPESRAAPGSVRWDPEAGYVDTAGLEDLDAVVNLAGESIAERWTPERKRKIGESRERGTRLLAETLATLGQPPRVLVSGSAVGYYGAHRGDEELTEESAAGEDFLAGVAQRWEAAAEPAARAGIRVVHPRFGLVLDAGGGALARMLTPFRLGVGGKLGSGKQWLSWIALIDAVNVVQFSIATPTLQGPVNAVSPEPVTNDEFVHALGAAIHRPAGLAVPETALRLAFGEMADATLLASQRALPRRLLAAGFVFRYPRIAEALKQALKR